MRLSIILPVYNVAKFIPDCLDSLLCQDIPQSEYEIICVDDGSPDNSAEVIQSYQEKYDNIRLIRQANAGVSTARNNGLTAAQGVYIWFIDPDDYIQANCLGTILSALENANADLCDFRFIKVEEGSRFSEERKEQVAFSLQSEYYSLGSAGQYIFRKGYWEENGLSFHPSLAYGEDYLIAFQLNYRKHVGLSTQAAIYRYRQRQGSAMNSSALKKRQRHMQDMHQLGVIYAEEYMRCKNENLPKNVLKNIRARQRLCAQSAIMDLVRIAESKQEVKKGLTALKKDGLYSYPIMWSQLWGKSLNANKKARLFSLFFPIKSYVIFVNWLYRRKRKKK